jgi:hypothetical protein
MKKKRGRQNLQSSRSPHSEVLLLHYRSKGEKKMKEHQIHQLTHLYKWWRLNPPVGSGGGT